VTYFNSAVALC